MLARPFCQPHGNLFHRHGPGGEISLREVDSYGMHRVPVLLRFSAFRDDAHMQAPPEFGIRIQYSHGFGIFIGAFTNARSIFISATGTRRNCSMEE